MYGILVVVAALGALSLSAVLSMLAYSANPVVSGAKVQGMNVAALGSHRTSDQSITRTGARPLPDPVEEAENHDLQRSGSDRDQWP